jgi:hypothetical protein
MTLFKFFFLVVATLVLPGAARGDVVFEWPVACTLGENCTIQHYVDHDDGPGVRDFQCGTMANDKHNGTDIRLRTLAAQKKGVAVLAAAAGRVLRRRDDMPDVSTAEKGAPSVIGRECGNGAVVAHEDGWETQYCHMARGSIAVQPGDTVSPGQPLGKIGLSGQSEFPHLHFTVRRGGKVIDPFAYGAASGACGGGKSIWAPNVQAKFVYRPGEVLNAGFASKPVTMADIDSDLENESLAKDPPALVAFVRAIGLRKGDTQQLALLGPDGVALAEAAQPPLDNNKAQYMMFVGKKKPAGGWPEGQYTANYSVLREGQKVLEKQFGIRL